MPQLEYKIMPYRDDLIHEVVHLLRFLYGDDHNQNMAYFRWKHYHNPCAEKVFGVVALFNKSVVGFRGYFPTKWIIRKIAEPIVILSPGDTCVDPAHRRKRLSLAMGQLAMQIYQQHYKAFLNLSASKTSVPGYLRMGFVPLMEKTYLSTCRMSGLIKFLITRKKTASILSNRVKLGKFGDVVVSNLPLAKQMSVIALNQTFNNRKIFLYQDESFFDWRYANPRYKYLFYYLFSATSLNAYLVLRLHKNNRRAYIVDYASIDNSAYSKLLGFIINNRHFDILSIYDFELENEFRDHLDSLFFKKTGLLRFLERKFVGDWPLLVRPIRENCSESDWFINDVDIRKRSNWEIKEICSDGI